jgi:hypothetical protein
LFFHFEISPKSHTHSAFAADILYQGKIIKCQTGILKFTIWW